jgi:hypothetical protein
MREPREWDEEYILSSLPIGEHTWLEAKGRQVIDLSLPDVKEESGRKTLSKALSALANSGGGVLLLGMNEDATGWEIDDGGIALSFPSKGRITTREWLVNIIPTLVDGPLRDFDVYVITRKSENSQIAEERGVFVVRVGDSERAPHQALNRVYYGRSGSDSVALNHTFVTDIFNRRRHPKLELSVEFHFVRQRRPSAEAIVNTYFPEHGRPGGESVDDYEIESILEAHFTVKNVGRVLIDYMHCSVYIPKELLVFELARRARSVRIDDVDYVVWKTDNIERDTVKDSGGEETGYGSSWYRRILPGMSREWVWGNLRDDMVETYSGNVFLWEIFADNAPVDRGRILIADISKVFERGVRLR